MSDVLRLDTHESARDAAIRAFLKTNPDFVRDDAELMQALGVRLDASNVVDFGPAALSRAAHAHRLESHERQRIEQVARDNFDAQARIHEGAIELIGARNHVNLARRLDQLAQTRFELATAVLALEGPERAPAGWLALAEGQVDLTLGFGQPARLGVLPTARGLFGDKAGEVGSMALIRLSMWSPERTGVLAFGAASEDAFTPDMGHELIDFLARVVERVAERWPIA